MFNKMSTYAPQTPDQHVGNGTELRITISDGEHSWAEDLDLLDLLQSVLQAQCAVALQDGWLVAEGFFLRPEILEVERLDRGGVRTLTTISVAHEQLVPHGLFEFQHASCENTAASIAEGFKQWMKTDWPVLLDSTRASPTECTSIDQKIIDPTPRVRRALLGPVSHVASRTATAEEEHPFCPCCLLTNSYEAFRTHLEGDGYFAVRLLALRNSAGEVTADCRINGVDWEVGKEHLMRYAKTWPDRGFEMRKQYVVLCTKVEGGV